MKLSSKTKKILFFWTLFHLIGYTSFLTGFTPSFKSDSNNIFGDSYEYFVITPRYDERLLDFNGLTTHSIFPNCLECSYNEKQNFWPFHKFTYGVETGYSTEKGFIGLWGYYGNYEFIVYLLIPYLFLGFRFIYKKYISK